MRLRTPSLGPALSAALALLAATGCTAITERGGDSAYAGAAAPALSYPATGIATQTWPAYGGAIPPPFAAYGAGAPVAYAAPVVGGGPGAAAAVVDPYCREAVQEARAAEREAELAARDARLGAYAGAPGWAQAQDARRAQEAAAEAERTRHFARRDC
jgi:hypothetical protein